MLFCCLRFITEHGQGVLAVPAKRYLLSVVAHDYGVVIGSDVNYGGLEDFTLRDGRRGLPGDEMAPAPR